jgi:hypothetical protein
MNRKDRVLAIIKESLLKEYNLPQKNVLVSIINQLILNTPNTNQPDAFEKKLNAILEFYRYNDTNFQIEDKIVYEEFKGKLVKLAKENNIPLNL